MVITGKAQWGKVVCNDQAPGLLLIQGYVKKSLSTLSNSRLAIIAQRVCLYQNITAAPSTNPADTNHDPDSTCPAAPVYARGVYVALDEFDVPVMFK